MRIAAVNIPDNKRAVIALTYIHGIGQTTAGKILADTKVDPDKHAGKLTAEEINRIQSEIDNNYRTEGELRQSVRQDINRLKDIKSYRGTRHLHNLPAHGQRTKSNSRTVRGNVRKTAGSGKRKVELK
jgi:small subunit ribosomal protein S13